MNEKRFEMKIRKELEKYNAWVLKTWSNGIQRSGIPDLIVCLNGHFVGIEVKAEKGKPSELQKYNIKKIKEAGGIAMIVYPDDFEDLKKLLERLNYE